MGAQTKSKYVIIHKTGKLPSKDTGIIQEFIPNMCIVRLYISLKAFLISSEKGTQDPSFGSFGLDLYKMLLINEDILKV